MSIVRDNLMTKEHYTPYCGDNAGCYLPRTYFDGEQFVCGHCGWKSEFPKNFIDSYRLKWGIVNMKYRIKR
jgi:hypothetical protein